MNGATALAVALFGAPVVTYLAYRGWRFVEKHGWPRLRRLGERGRRWAFVRRLRKESERSPGSFIRVKVPKGRS